MVRTAYRSLLAGLLCLVCYASAHTFATIDAGTGK